MTVPMALVDYIPVVMFLTVSILLQRDLYNKMSKGAFALFATGTIMVTIAGIYKATWKLLYAMNVCDFVVLNRSFFPMQSTGFVLAGIALIALLAAPQGKNTLYVLAITPVLYESSMIFVILTVLGVLGICGSMVVISARMKRIKAIILFVLAFIFMMGMGYLSSRDFTQASMNWIAEATNILAQGILLLGVLDLHRAGLSNF